MFSGSVRVVQTFSASLLGAAQGPLHFDICVEIGIQSENQVQCLPIAYSVTSFNGREGFFVSRERKYKSNIRLGT